MSSPIRPFRLKPAGAHLGAAPERGCVKGTSRSTLNIQECRGNQCSALNRCRALGDRGSARFAFKPHRTLSIFQPYTLVVKISLQPRAQRLTVCLEYLFKRKY